MAEEFHIELGEDILAFLAQRVRTNVRGLEGALMRVASYLSLSSREISCETVEQLLRDILREEAKKPCYHRSFKRRWPNNLMFDSRI